VQALHVDTKVAIAYSVDTLTLLVYSTLEDHADVNATHVMDGKNPEVAQRFAKPCVASWKDY
jgi:hypothetical protein